MTFRFGNAGKLFIAILLAHIPLPCCQSQSKDHAQWTASIQLLVRDDREVPISGLSAADFTVTEHGAQSRIVEVRNLSQLSGQTQPDAEISKAPFGSIFSTMREVPPPKQAWVLFVLAPMSASGRGFAIESLLKVLKRPETGDWRIAMLDDEGEFIPFSQSLDSLRSRLEKLAKHASSPQLIDGPWVGLANRAIEELAIRPGRHAIVFASDFEWNVSAPEARNPHLLRVGPSEFVGAAVHAQAAMYTVQEGSGPGVVVPFGGASEWQYSGSGQQMAEMLMAETVSLGSIRSDFLYAAAETGGLPAADIEDAFAEIAADAAGYYQITFEPRLQEADGAWHPISISVRQPHARIRGPRYYLAPTEENRLQIPASLKEALKQEALKQGASTSGLEIATHVWLFPDGGGVHTGIMAADLGWPAIDATEPNGSRLQIFAQLFDDSMGRVVGSWLSNREWHSEVGQRPTIHWQREASLYPGSYTLRVAAMDSESNKIGARAYSFLVTPLTGPALRFSGVVIADRCMEVNEHEGRSNLLDPMILDGCSLAPAASGSFSPDQNPTIFVRLYPPDEKIGMLITKQWKA